MNISQQSILTDKDKKIKDGDRRKTGSDKEPKMIRDYRYLYLSSYRSVVLCTSKDPGSPKL